MSIQAAVNQGISIASLLATQYPGVKAAAEKRSKLKELGAKEAGIHDAMSAAGVPTAEAQAVRQQLQGDLAEIKHQQFLTDPSRESYEAYAKAYSGTEEGMEARSITTKGGTETTEAEDERIRAETEAELARERRRALASRSVSDAIDYLEKIKRGDIG